MKRRVIETVSNHYCDKTQHEALESVRLDYPDIDWVYYGWSSHNDSYVFDAVTDVSNIPEGLESYETDEDAVTRVIEAKSTGKACKDCRYFNGVDTCNHIANTQVVESTFHSPNPYRKLKVSPNHMCDYFELRG
jgi:hypothetical protein